MKALSDFNEGYVYAYLNKTDTLDHYYNGLINSYMSDVESNQNLLFTRAKSDFDRYLKTELIKSAGINQRNNEQNIFNRFICHKQIINSLISLLLFLIIFIANFTLNKRNKESNKDNIRANYGKAIDKTTNTSTNSND